MDLVVTTRGRKDHHATYGNIHVKASTEIELVQKLKDENIYLENFNHYRTYGNDYPYIWVWKTKQENQNES